MEDSEVPVGRRCKGKPVGGWGSLGKGLTVDECKQACNERPGCVQISLDTSSTQPDGKMLCHGRVMDAAEQGQFNPDSKYQHFRRVEDVNVRVTSGERVRNYYYPNVKTAEITPVCDLTLGIWLIQWTVRSGALHLYSADVEVVPPDHPYPPPPPWTGTPPRDNWRTPTQPWEHLFGEGVYEHSTRTYTDADGNIVTKHTGFKYGYAQNGDAGDGGGTGTSDGGNYQILDGEIKHDVYSGYSGNQEHTNFEHSGQDSNGYTNEGTNVDLFNAYDGATGTGTQGGTITY